MGVRLDYENVVVNMSGPQARHLLCLLIDALRYGNMRRVQLILRGHDLAESDTPLCPACYAEVGDGDFDCRECGQSLHKDAKVTR